MPTNTHPPTVVLASGNKGKLVELQQLLGERVHVVSAQELGVELPEETGFTFADNAGLKARATFQQTGLIALADDSGLEVDALDGQPGVFSARYAGENATDAANNEKLLRELKAVPDGLRSARFRSAIAVQLDTDSVLIFEGVCEGEIGFAPRGHSGFGYDPLFVLQNGLTMAELEAEDKNAISHRGEAMRQAIPVLMDHLVRRDGKP